MLIRPDSTAAAEPGKQPPCLVPCIRGGNVMALHSPYSTTIWDYINRSMPWTPEESGNRDKPLLSPDEVYALTAFLLYRSGIIQESAVMDAKSLPKVQMPNRNGFIYPDPVWKPGMKKTFGIYP